MINEHIIQKIRSFLCQNVNGIGETNPVPCVDDILFKNLGRIIAPAPDDAPLRILGIGLDGFLREGDDCHFALTVCAQAQRGCRSGNAAADDEDVCLHKVRCQ